MSSLVDVLSSMNEYDGPSSYGISLEFSCVNEANIICSLKQIFSCGRLSADH